MWHSAIRQFREDSGLRQSDIPGLTRRQVGRIERGQSGTSYKALAKFAKAHDLSPNDYLEKLSGLLPKPPTAQSEADSAADDETGKVILVETKASNRKSGASKSTRVDSFAIRVGASAVRS